MGWSWAMFIAQRVHQHQAMIAAEVDSSRVLVDGRPAPALSDGPVLVPYADNLNIIGTNVSEVQKLKNKIVNHLQTLGFRIHEEQDALNYAESLGFFLDGKLGRVYPRPNKLKKVQVVLDWLATSPRVSGRMIERAIGHCIHFSMLRRELLSVFRAVYDFKVVHYEERVKLWSTAATEFAMMSALLDICYADLRRPWSQEITASDASLSGTGVCGTCWSHDDVAQVGRQRELWRFRAEDAASKARDHVRGLDPFVDVNTVLEERVMKQKVDIFQLNLDFQEISRDLLREEDWKVLFSTRMTLPEHITLLEGRGIAQALRHKARSSNHFHKRHVHLNDNLGMVLSFDRGRAKNKALLFQCRRGAAHAIATDSEYHFRWIPSEFNIADKPSRLLEPCSHASKSQQKKNFHKIIYPGREQETPSREKHRGCHFEGNHQAVCRPQKASKACRHQEKNFRSNRARSQNQAAKTDVGARCKTPGAHTDLFGASSCLVPNCGRLQVSDGNLSNFLSPTQAVRAESGAVGQCPYHFPAAMLQRRDGLERGNQILGSSPRFSARGSSQTLPAKDKKVSTRVEKLGSRPESATHALAGDCQNGPRHAEEQFGGPSYDGPHHVCHLLPTDRSDEASHHRSGVDQTVRQHAVSQSEHLRRDGDIKDGKAGRNYASGQSGASLAGSSASALPQKEGQKWSKNVPHRILHLPEKLEVNAAEHRTARGLGCSLPVKALRGFMGSVQKVQNSVGGENERQMGCRQLHGKIRKACNAISTVRAAPGGPEKRMPVGCQEHQESGPKKFGAMTASTKVCLEIFSGTSRVAKALAAKGFASEAWDILFGSACDISDVNVLNSILDRVSAGKILYIHIGLPWQSWSRARRNDGRGPGPLRDDNKFLMGLPNLSSKDRQKVLVGNLLLRHSIRIIRACQQNGVPWSLENPMTSRVWKVRMVKQLKNCHFQRTDFCQWGLPWRKSTYFLLSDALQPQFRVCSGTHNRCSQSLAPHVLLQGTQNGQFLSKIAEPYPFPLVNALVKAISIAIT